MQMVLNESQVDKAESHGMQCLAYILSVLQSAMIWVHYIFHQTSVANAG